ncbi:MAG TPA: LPXTG cell wall anchor domain-containing protein [Candidatus Pullilachnospira intestinigallinarum]|nr:LPXTG cell wall anchor domain-containing protein [Candidatus Pullilachnospira intestinigallinarum]
MKRRKAVLAGVTAFLFTTAAAAAFSQVSTMEILTTGKVDILLEELSRDTDGTSAWKDGMAVMPGMTVSKIPRISNAAADCYVRALVEFTGGEESGRTLDAADLYGISEDWVRRGDYYYYKKILKSGESTELFQGIRIPGDWEQAGETENDWEVRVQVDAVQAVHMEPDFEDESPWETGGRTVPIETARMEEPVLGGEEQSEMTAVLVDETARQLLAVPEDFIGDFGSFLPGDEKERQVQLENRTGDARSLYFRVETEKKEEWMDQMELAVTVTQAGQEKIHWEGKLTDSQWEEYRQICRLSPGETGQLTVSLKLPEELGNQYSARTGEALFELCADEETVKNADAPKTGDASGPILALAAAEAGAAVILAAGIWLRVRKKGGNDGKKGG